MPNMPTSERLIGKLRANGILPRKDGFIQLRKGKGDGGKWSWRAVDTRTGETLNIGSHHTMTEILDAKKLKTRTDDDGRVNVEPG